MNPDLPPEVLFLCDRCKQPVMESDSWYTTNTIELCGECAYQEAQMVVGIVRQILGPEPVALSPPPLISGMKIETIETVITHDRWAGRNSPTV